MERPILFSGEMVRAILDGKKTQTRRVIKPQPPDGWNRFAWYDAPMGGFTNEPSPAGNWFKAKCPYGEDGDVLWVRERWRVGAWDDYCVAVDYRADNYARREFLVPHTEEEAQKLRLQTLEDAEKSGCPKDTFGTYLWEPGKGPARWRPSIHMPRWASRISLRITDIRVERVQEIEYDDILAEGIPVCHTCNGMGFYEGGGEPCDCPYCDGVKCSEETEVHALWDSINAKRGHGWDANPWVWVVTFERIVP